MSDLIQATAEVVSRFITVLLWLMVIILCTAAVIGIPILIIAAIYFVVSLFLHLTFTWPLAILIGTFTEVFLVCIVMEGETL